MPRVSVILTSYNHAEFICESIESVLAQTFSDFELLILDDASTDNSWWLINQYDDPRIKAFRSGGAGEVILRINAAVSEMAQGEYIAIHHSDDVWEHDKLARQVACLDQNPDVGVAFTRVLAITENGTPLANRAHYYFSIFDQPNRSRQEWLRFFYDHGNALCHPSALIRSECFRTCGLYRPWLMQVDDFDMWMRILMRYDIHVLHEKLTRFRVRGNDTNVSGNNRGARVRGIYEQHGILENYKDIACFEDLLAIFPEAAKYYRGPDTDLLFSIGRSALDAATRPFAQLFALNVILEVLSDPARCARIEEIHDFDMNDFLDLTSRYDVFSSEEVARLGDVLSEREHQVANLERGASERDAVILDIHKTLSQREEQLARLEQSVSERDASILDIRQTLAERDHRIANLDRGVTERDALILRTHQTLSEREALIGNLTQGTIERDALILGIHHDLSERDSRIANLEQGVTERDALILSIHHNLSERDSQIANLEQGIAERDTLILGIHHDLSERNSQIANLEEGVAEQDALILAIRNDLSERDNQVASLEQGGAERDALILAIRNDLSERNNQIANLEQGVAERDALILGIRHDLSERDSQVAGLEQAITDYVGKIHVLITSASWKLTRPLRFAGRLVRGDMAAAFAPLRRSRTLRASPPSQPATTGDAGHTASVSMQDIAPLPRQQGVSAALREVVSNATRKKHSPDTDFDEAFYLENNPDVRESGMDPYQHFIHNGRAEGRIGSRPRLVLQNGAASLDASKKTVLVVSHEASRTGAPVLSLNIARELQKRFNVVVLVLGGGPLIPAFCEAVFLVAGPVSVKGSVKEADHVIEQLAALHEFEFAIVNSIESRAVLRGLAKLSVPAISLIHEFAAYTRPRDAFRFAMRWSMEVVFSARITHANAVSEYPELADHSFHILPQGRCTTLAAEIDPDAQAAERKTVLRHLRPRGDADKDTVVIIGAGYVHYRKGVDLFLESAARVVRSPGGEHCRFVWIGNGYDPMHDMGYSVYLAEQVRRAGLAQQFTFLAETSAIEEVYASADILMLSSRLDPLPNVAIDAMSHGLPVVCFAQATGIVDALAESGLSDACVAPYLDTASMAELVLNLARSKALRNQVGARLKQAVREQFDMVRYVTRLEELAIDAKHRLTSEIESSKDILGSQRLRPDFFLRSTDKCASPDDMVRYGYVRSWAAGIDRRKPFPGFHPGIYLESKGVEKPGMDPFASYLRAGQPNGPWQFEVISSQDAVAEIPSKIRIGLHLHAYYPDLLDKILGRLGTNEVRPDLFISVCDEEAAATARSSASGYTGSLVDVRVVPNAGRDLGPFLTAFGSTFAQHYDIVGHLHTKKSADIADEATGRIWFDFLLENLLGGSAPMADIILGRMAADPSIGIVFPDDPHVVGWGANKPYAETLAARLDLPTLPENLAFPVGSMFWAKTEAIRPLFDLGLGWQDYPSEPLPYDGSMLHAMERMLPLVTAKQSTRVVVTNVVGVTR